MEIVWTSISIITTDQRNGARDLPALLWRTASHYQALPTLVVGTPVGTIGRMVSVDTVAFLFEGSSFF
mgnify:CR=1 FL=1